jgi:uncharacterized membrane protein YkvA (DUF1232 family)
MTKTTEGEKRLQTVLERIGPEFIEHGARRMTRADLDDVVARRPEVDEQLEEGGALERDKRHIRQMAELLADYRSGAYTGAPYWTIAIAVFALQYVVKPVDIIPDILPVVGQLDDAMVVSHASAMIQSELKAYSVWKLAAEVAG